MGMQRILIVEDDSEINNMIKEFLEGYDYNCHQAFSGSECKLLTHMESYDLILLDLMLPGISGEELIQELAKTSKVIVLSAKSGIESKVNLLELGANDYICKPFNISELVKCFEEVLQKNIKKTRISGNVIKTFE